MRACWAGSIGPLLAETQPVATLQPPAERPALGFVPVESRVSAGGAQEPPVDDATPPRTPSPDAAALTLGWTLWGDAFL
jgi:hypothetical protein